METKIYNIDSKYRNTTSYPNSCNFVYNSLDTTINSVVRIEPFNEKNIIEMKLLSIDIPNTLYYINSSRGNNIFNIGSGGAIYTITLNSGSYTANELVTQLNSMISSYMTIVYSVNTNKMTINNISAYNITITFTNNNTGYDSLGVILGFINNSYNVNVGYSIQSDQVIVIPQEKYFFLSLNELGDIVNKNKKYVAKLIRDTAIYNTSNYYMNYKIISNSIKLEQPQDIKNLRITLEDELGNILDLNGANFSFTLELTIITNTILKALILKNYEQVRFYSEPVMERILQAKMLAYYEKEINESSNNTLTGTYNKNLVNFNNIMEYNPNGNKMNY